jgi:hypothetical protein
MSLIFERTAMPLTVLPSALIFGEKLAKAPKEGITVRSPPETPDFAGTPSSLVNFPAPLYIPQVVMTVTTAYTVLVFNILSPVDGTIPLFASMAPNRASDLVLTIIEQFLKYRSSALSAPSFVCSSLLY